MNRFEMYNQLKHDKSKVQKSITIDNKVNTLLQYYSNKLNYPYSTMINQVLKE
jgi:hypothetical protein